MDVIEFLPWQATNTIWSGRGSREKFATCCSVTKSTLSCDIGFKCWTCFTWFLSGEASVANSPETHPFEWWRSSNRCMLGSLLSFRWSKWQNSGSDWSWRLSTSCGAFAVSSHVCYKLSQNQDWPPPMFVHIFHSILDYYIFRQCTCILLLWFGTYVTCETAATN